MAWSGVVAAVAVLTVSGCVGGWAVLGRARRFSATVANVAALGGFLAPWMVRSDLKGIRFFFGVVAFMMAMKLFDLSREARRGRVDVGVWEFLAFLFHPFAFVFREARRLERISQGDDLRALARASAGLVIGLVVAEGVFGWSGWVDAPFLVEHLAKVVAIYLVVMPATSVFTALWRRLGGRALEVMVRPELARTPADFWRRYNLPVGQFFFEDVFKPSGGLRAPARATLVVFAVSGLAHESILDVASGRLRGTQTVFFLVQGLAVAATWRLRPRGRYAEWAGVVATFAFNIVTSMLFFNDMDAVFPFYDRRRAG